MLAFTSWLQRKGRKFSQITACCTFQLDQIRCEKYTIFSVLANFACWAPVDDRKQSRQWAIYHIQISGLSFPMATLCLIYLLSWIEICFVKCMTFGIFKLQILHCSLKKRKRTLSLEFPLIHVTRVLVWKQPACLALRCDYRKEPVRSSNVLSKIQRCKSTLV